MYSRSLTVCRDTGGSIIMSFFFVFFSTVKISCNALYSHKRFITKNYALKPFFQVYELFKL